MNGYTLYLLHFEPRFKHAGHYLGVARGNRNVVHRWLEHKQGKGANLTRHAKNAGSQLILARIWLNAEFKLETKLKGRGLAPLCPICSRRA